MPKKITAFVFTDDDGELKTKLTVDGVASIIPVSDWYKKKKPMRDHTYQHNRTGAVEQGASGKAGSIAKDYAPIFK